MCSGNALHSWAPCLNPERERERGIGTGDDALFQENCHQCIHVRIQLIKEAFFICTTPVANYEIDVYICTGYLTYVHTHTYAGACVYVAHMHTCT